ncbi:MAG TPA: outer membrane beta-barrel protein [Gemmatimonadales bacterium]|jgi:hypothetical protein|nr:outer membrane beta-barrel protein [Gemmatimonadales bacterium]
MPRSTLILTALLAGATAAVLPAQSRPAPELGLFGRYTHYSGDIGLDDAFGFGARAGYYLSPVLSVEGDGSYSTSNAGALDISHLPVHLRALLNLPFSDRLSVFLGTGPVLDLYGKDYSLANLGLGTTLGARIGITPQFMVRVGGTWDWVFVTQKGTPGYGNPGIDFGVSFFPGRPGGPSASGDEDGDGVPNGADACPGTPPGSTVDARGCVKRADSDNDGVIDINDICPGTPAGAKVDANGCSGTEPKANPR